MAVSTKLSLNFYKADDKTMNLSYKYARQDPSNANIKALMEGIVTNGTIFKKVPVSLKSAQIITTETTEVDLS